MAATPDDVLAQIRSMPLEDRDYIEAELMRDAYESGRRNESPALVAELVTRAADALANPDRGISRTDAVASARASVEAARTRKS
jgi:hypothetical protein